MTIKIPYGYMTISQLTKIFEVSKKTITKYCEEGFFEGAKKEEISNISRWIVPSAIVEKIKLQNEEIEKYIYSVSEFAEALQINSNTIFNYIAEGKIPSIKINNVFQSHGIKIDKRNPVIKNLLKQKEEIDNGTFINQKEAAKLLNIPIQQIQHIRKYMDENDQFKFFGNLYLNKAAMINIFNRRLVETNYVSANEAAKKLQLTSSNIRHFCLIGNIPNAKKIKNKWFVPKEYVEKQLELQQNFLTIDDFANQLGVSRNAVYYRLSAGLLPHFIFKDNIWRINISDVSIYKEDPTIFAKKPRVPQKIGNKETLIKNLNKRISEVKKPHHKLFTKLYLEWCEGLISKSRAKYNSLRSHVADLIKVYTLIITLFPKDIDKDTPNLTEEILTKTEAQIRLHEKFSAFLNYAYGQMDINPPKKVKVSYIKKNDDDKEIYSPEIYQEFNLFVREIGKHIPKACKSPKYANMWVYVSLHLTDVWRHTDLIEKIPNISLEQIGVDKHTWFKENRLSLEQCQKVVNQLYLKLRPEVTNKTRSHLTFLVEPTLIEIVGHAVVISEIHRRQYKREYLLFTLFSSSGEPTHFSRSPSLLQFFDEKPELKVFRNQIMNNSTMTYLHYSIIEEDADNADVALSVPQQSRSHKKEDTTRIYVSVTNKDGSVNRVAPNVLARGNFGWLYNFMVIHAIEGKDVVQSMEERTKTIQGLREDIAPKELENWSQYLNNQKLKRESVIKQLLKMSKSELIFLIREIFSQKMPAKTKPGQCMIYPSCKYPERKNCFGCEYFVPQYYVLIEAAKEFKRLIKSMTEARYEATFIRDKKWLLSVLDIYSEAKVFFEPELINGFLSPKEIKEGIASLRTIEFIE